MNEERKTPGIVTALSQLAKGNPIDWFVAPDESRVVIVFEDGRKVTFEQEEIRPMLKKHFVVEEKPAQAQAEPKKRKA